MVVNFYESFSRILRNPFIYYFYKQPFHPLFSFFLVEGVADLVFHLPDYAFLLLFLVLDLF